MAFGADASSGFDWGSLLNTAVTTAGNVVTASITGGTSAAYPYGTQINPATGMPYTMQPTTNYSTLLLLGIAGVAAYMIFSRKKGKR